MLRRIKIDAPKVYDGKADLDAFDRWALEVTTWKRLNRLSDEFVITLLNKYVTDKAGVFYMKYVARKVRQWTLTDVFEGLFDYCFPKDFKSTLRRRLMTANQGRTRVSEFIRDIELMAGRFPDVNKRSIIEIFWWGIRPALRVEVIKMGANPERSSLDTIVDCAIRAEDSILEAELAQKKETVKEGRTWGRFANRSSGPRPYRPSREDGHQARGEGRERVRANAVTPQPRAGPSRTEGRHAKRAQRGKKISREKRDQLRAEGKCFQCEQQGHSQRDCPELNTLRPPRMRVNNVEIARLERLAKAKDKADLQVGHVSLETDTVEDDATPTMQKVYQQCADIWGSDEKWSNPETRYDSKYRIYQYSTGKGDLVEIRIQDKPEIGTFEIDVERFNDPEFVLTDVLDLQNTDQSCVRLGGFRDRRNYDKWKWPALNWLRKLVEDQLAFEKSEQTVSVQPSFEGYGLHIEGTDVHYQVTHAEVLGDILHIGRILNAMRAVRELAEWERSPIFWSMRLNPRQRLVFNVNATNLMAGSVRQRKRGTEGVSSLEKTSMRVKDQSRKVPEPIVILATINGHEVRALIDTGSMADFISTTVVEQLKLKKEIYAKPLSVQLAVHGSRSKINCGTRVKFEYQSISCERRFDIANLDNYDVILGTPFLYQHKIVIGLNPPCVVVGSNEPTKMNGPDVITITSAAADLLDDGIDKLRQQLRAEADDLCPDTSRTVLPPLRAVNHTIPLIDPKKIYRFRPSKCPEAFREQWRMKKNAYLETGRWRTATGHNAIPLLMIPKVSSTSDKPGLRTVFDKREQNSNTYKLASPLPDIEEILREVSKHKFRSLIDGKDAYEQIRVVPEHVSRTLFTTPDGTMESLVMQQGDCNAGATYQTLMNHVFAPYLGVFMFVYLDDIIIFSDSVEEHLKHVRTIFDVLRREKLYLGPNKMQFFAEELKILGHVIDAQGIRMDPHKVDKVVNWKTPTNKDLLRSFIGAVGFLAPDCKGIRIPMGQLSSLTAELKPWRWDATAQRSFEEVKNIVNTHRDDRRKALDYSKGADPIFVTTDGCLTGGGGFVSQGKDPKGENVVAFWSGKWNSAQQNYPVHEQELLALVETLKRFRGILHGTKFTIRTDHRALTHFMKQKNLSARQHRWIDILSEFDFEIEYIPGETNGFADALSRIYSDETPGVIRATSELIDDKDELKTYQSLKTSPIYVETYLLSLVNAEFRRSSRLASKPSPDYKETGRRKSRGDRAEPDEPKTNDSEEREEGVTRGDVDKKSETTKAQPQRTTRGPETQLLEVSGGLGIEFPGCVRNRYTEDPFFKPILENPDDFTNFQTRDGLTFFKSEGVEVVAIPDIKVDGQGVRELLIRQGHSVLAHLGAEKTATYLRDQVWWKSMVSDIEAFCRTCNVCATSKPQNGKPQGKLKTMPVPTRPWQYIGIDFVGPLPESSNRTGGYDMICVIIDLLTSMVHLVPSRQTYRASDIAELIFDSVYKLHGLPERIISDRDSLFTSKFWKRLHRLLNTELRMSSAFHPQTDGATERANRTMTQMIRQCVSPDQKDWVVKLPAVEFAINSARSSTTGFSPFQLNYGRNPSSLIWKVEDEFPGVQKFAEQMKLAIMRAHDSIIASRIENTVQANKKRTLANYKEGDLVYLSTKNISLPKGLARKLAPKYLGPFAITRTLKEGATYQLDLSEELIKRGINPAFHASLLKPHVPNDDRRFPGRLPSQIPGFGKRADEWIVEAISDHQGKGINSDFQITWKAGDKTWAPYREVAHLMAMERYCELMGVDSPNDLPAKRGSEKFEAREVVLFSARVATEGYKGRVEPGETLDNPTMPRSLSHSEFAACAVYAQHLRDSQAGLRLPPSGPPPPGYEDYILLMATQDGPIEAHDRPPSHQPGPHGGDPYATVSMPPEAFNHLMSSQVHITELVTGYRNGSRYSRPKPYTPTYESRGGGRGFVRGRGGGHRGTRGRSIPRGLGNNRRSRPSNWSDDDDYSPPSSRERSRSRNRRSEEPSHSHRRRSEERPRSGHRRSDGHPHSNREPGEPSRSNRTTGGSSHSNRPDQSGRAIAAVTQPAPDGKPSAPSNPPAPAQLTSDQSGSSTATDRAADSKFRNGVEEDGDDSFSEGTGTIGSTESAFLRARDVPAEEMESALGWRMNVLRDT